MAITAKHRKRLDPRRLDALLVDLDGVVTDTAAIHASAWKALFDEFLKSRAERRGTPFEPFDAKSDYLRFVDGKARYDGVRSFLASRGISLPDGDPGDPADRETVCGLGNRKNAHFRHLLDRCGVRVWESSVDLIDTARARGLTVAVISSSKNCAEILKTAGIADLFDASVDGAEQERLNLSGKPAPDSFLEAARRLGVRPERAAVVEDALAGVEAGRNGGFGLVIGVDRAQQAEALTAHGADVVVADLGELEIGGGPTVHRKIPSALRAMDDIARRVDGTRVAVFLDYDGTLTPIVDRPELAVLSNGMRATLRTLADECAVAVVSGRSRADVAKLVGLRQLFYAGSHGFDIAGPGGLEARHREGRNCVPAVAQADKELRDKVGSIDGVLVEGKILAIAVHYRLVAERDVPVVEAAVDEVAARHPELRKTGGKKVFELRPRMDWDKGKAVLWLLNALGLRGPDVTPFYLGDDLTDEDAFAALTGRGIGIVVSERPLPTAADYRLHDPGEVRAFLEALSAVLAERRR